MILNLVLGRDAYPADVFIKNRKIHGKPISRWENQKYDFCPEARLNYQVSGFPNTDIYHVITISAHFSSLPAELKICCKDFCKL